MAYPAVLVRTKTWGTEVMTAADLHGQLDLIIAWIDAFADETSGHKHDATTNEGPKIATGGLADNAVTGDILDDDGNFTVTGDWCFTTVALAETTAPTTAAGEMMLYTKDTGGQPELFAREESAGGEVQITEAGHVKTEIRAWCTFDGTTNTGGKCTVGGSRGVDDVDDNGTGDYTINWTTAFADTNYVVFVCCKRDGAGDVSAPYRIDTKATTSLTINTTVIGGATLTDMKIVDILAIGDIDV